MQRAKLFLEEEIINSQVMHRLLDEEVRKTKELEAVNQTLIESNNQYENKWKRMWGSFIFYRNFYMKMKCMPLKEGLSGQTNLCACEALQFG